MDKWMEEAHQLRADKCRGFLFLCVANSARSQMAEGIARHLVAQLPADKADAYRILSAGSHPTRVRPEAHIVLAELGIDISAQFSKNVADIFPDDIDVVITLCAEETCPMFMGHARRLHWGLPDPASDQGTMEQRLPAFRATRDELLRRLKVALAPADG